MVGGRRRDWPTGTADNRTARYAELLEPEGRSSSRRTLSYAGLWQEAPAVGAEALKIVLEAAERPAARLRPIHQVIVMSQLSCYRAA